MPATFAPTTLDRLETTLEQRRTSALQLANTLQRDAAAALEDIDISDLFDSDDPDGGTNLIDRLRALHLAHVASTTAGAADTALARLAAGTYGTCERCDGRIPLARLRALPETTLCVDCKRADSGLLALVG